MDLLEESKGEWTAHHVVFKALVANIICRNISQPTATRTAGGRPLAVYSIGQFLETWHLFSELTTDPAQVVFHAPWALVCAVEMAIQVSRHRSAKAIAKICSKCFFALMNPCLNHFY